MPTHGSSIRARRRTASRSAVDGRATRAASASRRASARNRVAVASLSSRCCRSRPPQLAPRDAAVADATPRGVRGASPVRAVLWDLDGTLTDSVRFVVDTANRVIEAHGGTTLDFDRVGSMTGLPLAKVFALVWPDLTPDTLHGYVQEYRDIYDREVVPATRLYRGALATLHSFHAA